MFSCRDKNIVPNRLCVIILSHFSLYREFSANAAHVAVALGKLAIDGRTSRRTIDRFTFKIVNNIFLLILEFVEILAQNRELDKKTDPDV